MFILTRKIGSCVELDFGKRPRRRRISQGGIVSVSQCPLGDGRKARISGNIVTGVSAATMELAHCRWPPLLNAPQMGDKRRRPILPTKRDRAKISRARKQKGGRYRNEREKRGADIEKSESRFHDDQQANRNSVIPVEIRGTPFSDTRKTMVGHFCRRTKSIVVVVVEYYGHCVREHGEREISTYESILERLYYRNLCMYAIESRMCEFSFSDCA